MLAVLGVFLFSLGLLALGIAQVVFNRGNLPQRLLDAAMIPEFVATSIVSLMAFGLAAIGQFVLTFESGRFGWSEAGAVIVMVAATVVLSKWLRIKAKTVLGQVATSSSDNVIQGPFGQPGSVQNSIETSALAGGEARAA